MPHIFFFNSNAEQGSTVITEQPKAPFIFNYCLLFYPPVELPYSGNVLHNIGCRSYGFVCTFPCVLGMNKHFDSALCVEKYSASGNATTA